MEKEDRKEEDDLDCNEKPLLTAEFENFHLEDSLED